MEQQLTVPEEFATARLILRKPGIEDAEPIFSTYARDARVCRYTTWRVHGTIDETRNYLGSCREQWSGGQGFAYAIDLTGTPGRPIGMIHMRRGSHQMQYGYVLARDAWGNGFMTEALHCLVDWALSQDEIWRAAAYCDVDNMASARVMEKTGMEFEGVLRRYCIHPNVSDEPRDCRIYAKVR